MVSSIRLPAENRAAELAASFPYHRTEPQPQPESLRACAEKPAGKGAPAIRLLMEGGVHVVARDIVQKPLVHFLHFTVSAEAVPKFLNSHGIVGVSPPDRHGGRR